MYLNTMIYEQILIKYMQLNLSFYPPYAADFISHQIKKAGGMCVL